MHALVPASKKNHLISAVRHKRFLSSLIYWPVVFLIATGVGYVVFAWWCSPVIHLLEKYFDFKISPVELLLFSCVVSAIATTLLLIFMARQKMFYEYLYCSECDALDYDEEGVCPFCGTTLHQKETFFWLQYDDEMEILEQFRLHISKQ
jgi:hypothetical protein